MVILHTGLAIAHLNKPKYSFYDSDERLYRKITLHADAVIGLKNTNIAFLPGFVYSRQGTSSEFLPVCYFRYMLKEQSKFTGYVKGAALLLGNRYD